MTTVHPDASIADASRRMRECGATELLVMSEVHGEALTLGVVTAQDIVMRVLAVGLDPAAITAGDIARS